MNQRFYSLTALVLALLLLVCPARASSAGTVFPDVDSDEDYADAMTLVNELGIMVGDDKGYFNPEKGVTRAEMATIILRFMYEDQNLETGSSKFDDVPESHWANKYINKATSLGIIKGYGNGTFGPSDTVSYEQAITMILRALDLENDALEAGGYPDGYIRVACDYGYTNGLAVEKGDPMARWQIAVMLSNVLE